MPTKTPHLALCSILLASIPSLSYAHKLQSPESDTSINTQIGTLSNSSLPEYRENILAVILPNGHGGFETYTDSDAQVAYDTFIKSIDQDGILPTVEEESNLSEMETTQEITNNKESSAEQDLIPAKNIKYRFINVRRGITWG